MAKDKTTLLETLMRDTYKRRQACRLYAYQCMPYQSETNLRAIYCRKDDMLATLAQASLKGSTINDEPR